MVVLIAGRLPAPVSEMYAPMAACKCVYRIGDLAALHSSFRINLKCPNPTLPGDEPEKMYG